MMARAKASDGSATNAETAPRRIQPPDDGAGGVQVRFCQGQGVAGPQSGALVHALALPHQPHPDRQPDTPGQGTSSRTCDVSTL